MRHNLADFYLPLKAVEFSVVDITGFLKNFVFSFKFVYLSVIVVFLSHIVKKKNKQLLLKTYMGLEKF